jgi:hypothetical protein
MRVSLLPSFFTLLFSSSGFLQIQIISKIPEKLRFNSCDLFEELKCAKHSNLFNVLVISCSGDGSALRTNQRPAEFLTNGSIPPEILANGSTPPKEQWHSIDDLPIDWSLKSRARFTSPQVRTRRSLNQHHMSEEMF